MTKPSLHNSKIPTIKKEHLELVLDKIIPYPNNPRVNDKAVDEVVKSFKAYGYLTEIQVDEDNIILTGHTRLKAAQKLGLEELAVVRLLGLNPKQKKAFRIMDNKSGEFAEWDMEALGFEVEDLDFEITPIGFAPDELDIEPLEAEEDNYVISDEVETDIVLGDLIEVGEHRLLCGDSTDSDQVARLMNGEKADMVFTDPPYGIGYESKGRKIQNDERRDDKEPLINGMEIENKHQYLNLKRQKIIKSIQQ